MFLGFFYYLRSRQVRVSLNEWMTLMEALQKGLAESSLTRFYHLCRSICIKSEAHFDKFDQCFAEYFKGVEASEESIDKVLDWLRRSPLEQELDPEELAKLRAMDLDTLREEFEKRLAEQDEQHDGGNYWIGTGGTSPFGHGGVHPSGIRIGGPGRRGSAMQVATKRRFQNLRHDRILDVRQIATALRQLRRLTRDGREDELDIDETVDATARNVGDLEIVFRPPRKNTVKLLLLMDVGGSMTPHTRLSELLFSAAHAASHFKSFKHYYFHNCPYEKLYTDITQRKGTSTLEVLQNLDRTWYTVIVGDAAMSPYELTSSGGSIDFFHYNEEPGIRWLQRIRERFPRSVWINPDPPRYWGVTQSTLMIQDIFEMHPFTLDGLGDAISYLRKQKV